ncbi:MAG TPA: type II secretion system protein GspK [Fimbriimonas sp.]|nr:type II secretion system protein GspK [Fimbriimonas sp.]
MRRRESGSVFVLTLAVMAGLVLLLTSAANSNGESIRSQTNRMERERARLLVDSGIQRAIACLQSQDPNLATLNDDWATLGNSGDTEFEVGNDSFRIQILDACSRINVNTADQDTLKQLPLTSDQVDAIMDWRDAAKTPRPQGAKDEYYNQLQTPYNAKLQTLGSVDELLLVKGITPSMLYTAGQGGSSAPALSELLTVDSNSADQNPAKQPKLDANSVSQDQLMAAGVPQDQATAIVQNEGKYKRLGDVLGLPGMTKAAAHAVLDSLQVGSATQHPGLLNINTTPEDVLAAVPHLDPDIAASIVARQGDGFKSLGDLIDIPGMEMTNLSQVADRFCVGSRSFLVRVVGKAGRFEVAYVASLTLADRSQVQISRIQPEQLPDAPKRWGWPDVPSRQVVLGEQ